MIVLALLIPPMLLAAVILLSRFEERVFAQPREPRQQPHLRLVVDDRPGADEPLAAQRAA